MGKGAITSSTSTNATQQPRMTRGSSARLLRKKVASVTGMRGFFSKKYSEKQEAKPELNAAQPAAGDKAEKTVVEPAEETKEEVVAPRPQEEGAQEEAAQEEGPQEEGPQEEGPQEEAAQEEGTQEEQQEPAHQAPAHQAPVEEEEQLEEPNKEEQSLDEEKASEPLAVEEATTQDEPTLDEEKAQEEAQDELATVKSEEPVGGLDDNEEAEEAEEAVAETKAEAEAETEKKSEEPPAITKNVVFAGTDIVVNYDEDDAEYREKLEIAERSLGFTEADFDLDEEFDGEIELTAEPAADEAEAAPAAGGFWGWLRK